MKIVTREEWGARPPVQIQRLEHPIMYICMSFNEYLNHHSPEVVNAMQRSHMNDRMWDIQSNFIIFKDGTIYEGRGWAVQPSMFHHGFSTYNGKVLELALAGRFDKDEYNEGSPANKATEFLLKYGFENKLLHPDLKILRNKDAIYNLGQEYRMRLGSS